MCLTTPGAANLGTLLQGLSMLAALIWGFFEVRRRHKEKQAEKKSDIAEKALNGLDLFNKELEEWKASGNEHAILMEIHEDSEEIINNLILIKNTAARLNDYQLDSNFEQLCEIAKKLYYYYTEKNGLNKAQKAMQPYEAKIRSILRNYLLYQQPKSWVPKLFSTKQKHQKLKPPQQ